VIVGLARRVSEGLVSEFVTSARRARIILKSEIRSTKSEGNSKSEIEKLENHTSFKILKTTDDH